MVHQQLLSGRTTKPVIAVGQIWCSAVSVAKAGRVWKYLDLTSAFLTVVTIANGAQDRLTNGPALNTPACARSVSGDHYDLHFPLILCVSYFHLWMLPIMFQFGLRDYWHGVVLREALNPASRSRDAALDITLLPLR
jgi:hypothetical protein